MLSIYTHCEPCWLLHGFTLRPTLPYFYSFPVINGISFMPRQVKQLLNSLILKTIHGNSETLVCPVELTETCSLCSDKWLCVKGLLSFWEGLYAWMNATFCLCLLCLLQLLCATIHSSAQFWKRHQNLNNLLYVCLRGEDISTVWDNFRSES